MKIDMLKICGVYVHCAMRLMPFVFVRANEEWTEFSFEDAEWRIPAERMKMRRMHIVPIAKQPMAILKELREYSGNGQYLFPAKGIALFSEASLQFLTKL